MKRGLSSPARRVAVLLLSIGRDAAAAILRRLPDARVEEVARAMKELREVPLDREVVEDVQREFARRAEAGRTPLGDVDAQVDEVLRHALGEQRAGGIVARVERQVLSRRPFRAFENVDPQDLAAILDDEHPQVAAVILAHLEPRRAGRVLACAALERRVELLRRIASLERASVEVVQRVVDEVGRRIADLGLGAIRGEPQSWVETAAAIVNALGGGEAEVLDGIEASDPGLAERIRAEMFSFEDLAGLDRRSMQKLLAEVDTRSLALALKATSPAVEQNVVRNLSRRAAALLAEERAELGPTPLSEVLAAQQLVLAALRASIERGEIRVGEPDEELV